MGEGPTTDVEAARADLRDLTRDGLRAHLVALGQPAYRGDQVFEWIWRHGARSFDRMTNLPEALRAELAASSRIDLPEISRVDESTDGTRKLLVRLADGRDVETVLIPDGTRLTLCISSQVGCALACAFCATGTMGLMRNLRTAEIVGQVLLAQALVIDDEKGFRADPAARPITNIVLMGMGEPLHNYDNVLAALQILTDDRAFDYAPVRITVSTVGLVPQMLALGEALPVRLAVSLHAGNPETRRGLMPIDRKYSLDEVLDACRRFPLKARERITFEVTLLAGVNDSAEDARILAERISDLRCKVNVLPFNEHEGAPFARPTPEVVERFCACLREHDVDVFVRTTRGRDIAAACGQLAVGPRKSKRDGNQAPASPV